ncbi:10564_t:CDS:2, partial [Cetraspora pellucida]
FIWTIFWYFYGKSDPRDYSGISKEELDWIFENKSIVDSEENFGHYQSGSGEHIAISDDHNIPEDENDILLPKSQISSKPRYIQKIPWKLIFSRREVWAIMISHFFYSWGYFILISWLPTFYNEYLHVDINLIGYYTALPYFSYIVIGSIVGYICDYAIHQLKIRVLTVRRSTNIIGTLGISTSLLLMDIAPKYAGVIYALGNTCGMAPAFFGVALTGWILDVTNNNWSIIWIICSLFYIIGSIFFVSWAGGEIIID